MEQLVEQYNRIKRLAPTESRDRVLKKVALIVEKSRKLDALEAELTQKLSSYVQQSVEFCRETQLLKEEIDAL